MASPRGACIVTETYHPVVGGGETQARNLAEGLARSGFEVLVLTRRSDPDLASEERIGAARVHRLPPAGAEHYKKWGLLGAALPELLRRSADYDVVLVSGFRVLGVPAVLATRLLGKPCVLKADSLGEMSGDFFAAGLQRLGLRPDSPGFRHFLAGRDALLRRAEAFVAISSAVRDELLGRGVEPQRIHDIPNGVDTARFRPVDARRRDELRRQLGLRFAGPVAVYTGRLVSYKGLPQLLRAWDALRAAHPAAGLLLVGGGGLDIHNCEEELRRFAVERGMQGRLHFAGAVEDVAPWLQASDVFVFPTQIEAFGISAIEAMACGLPLVSTAAGGLADLVRDGANALVVEAGEEQALRQALERALSDAELRDRLGRDGRRRAVERYSTEAVTRGYVELFERLAGPLRPAWT